MATPFSIFSVFLSFFFGCLIGITSSSFSSFFFFKINSSGDLTFSFSFKINSSGDLTFSSTSSSSSIIKGIFVLIFLGTFDWTTGICASIKVIFSSAIGSLMVTIFFLFSTNFLSNAFLSYPFCVSSTIKGLCICSSFSCCSSCSLTSIFVGKIPSMFCICDICSLNSITPSSTFLAILFSVFFFV